MNDLQLRTEGQRWSTVLHTLHTPCTDHTPSETGRTPKPSDFEFTAAMSRVQLRHGPTLQLLSSLNPPGVFHEHHPVYFLCLYSGEETMWLNRLFPLRCLFVEGGATRPGACTDI